MFPQLLDIYFIGKDLRSFSNSFPHLPASPASQLFPCNARWCQKNLSVSLPLRTGGNALSALACDLRALFLSFPTHGSCWNPSGRPKDAGRNQTLAFVLGTWNTRGLCDARSRRFPWQLHSQKCFQAEPDEPQNLPTEQQAGKAGPWDSTKTALEMNPRKLPPPLAKGSTEPESLTPPKQPSRGNVCSQPLP